MVFDPFTTEVGGAADFLALVKRNCLADASTQRPRLAELAEHPVFRHDFLKLHDTLSNILLLTDQKREEFLTYVFRLCVCVCVCARMFALNCCLKVLLLCLCVYVRVCVCVCVYVCVCLVSTSCIQLLIPNKLLLSFTFPSRESIESPYTDPLLPLLLPLQESPY